MQSKTNNRPRWETVAAEARARGWRRGAELGVFDGRFTAHIMQNCPGVSLIAVDGFGLPIPKPKRRSSGEKCECEHCTTTREIRKTATPFRPREKFFLYRLEEAKKEYGWGARLFLIQDLTAHAAEKITDRSLDFLFVDAGHSYEMVNADLVAWRPKLRKTGAIFGHDWHMESVRRAVKDFFPRGTKIETDFPDHVWKVEMESVHDKV